MLAPVRIPDFVAEAETCLVACMIANPEIVALVRDRCPPEAFTRRENYPKLVAAIYAAADAGYKADGMMLLKYLEEKHPQLLKDSRGQDLIAEALRDANDNLASAVYNAEAYARAINKAHCCRLAARDAERLHELALAGDADGYAQTLVEVRDSFAHHYIQTEGVTGEEAVDAASKALQEGGDTALATGFEQLDWLTDGGMRDGELWLIGARPSVGKTAFALAIVRNMVRHGKHVLIVTTEMSAAALMDRLTSAETGVPLRNIRRRSFASAEEAARFQETVGALGPRVRVHETARGLDTPTAIEGALVRQSARLGDGLGLCVVDYVQNLRVEGHWENETVRIGEISRQLQHVAKATNVPLLVLAQLNRQAEARASKRPSIADLRQSGQLEQDADLVGLLWRPWHAGFDAGDNAAPEGMAVLFVEKQRNGPTGDVHLLWLPDRATFVQAAENWQWQLSRGAGGEGGQ